MNRTTKYLVIGLVVLCLAYPGFAWLIGLQVEASMLKREQQALGQYPGAITLVSRQYHRGVYGATEELTYGVGIAALRALAPLAPAADAATLRVTIHNTIHHGPLPQFRTLGLATVSSQVELPAALSAKLRALLGGEPVIRIRSRLGWFGALTTAIASPAYEGRLADGVQISWRGLEASGTSNASLTASSLQGTLVSLNVKSAKLQTELDGLQIRADLKRVLEGLSTGPFSLKIATVKWQSLPSSSRGLLQGLSIGGSGTVAGDYYKSAADFSADVIQTPDFSVTHAAYSVSAEHLHAPTLAAMIKDARASRADPSSASPLPPQAALENLKKNGIELLLHEPVLNISHIGFVMPEGELRLSATASAPGLTQEDLDGPRFQAALMQHLNVGADVRIDAALATRLLANNGRKDALAAQMQTLEQQGYIKRDGAALTAHLTFVAGKISVNGHPYPPIPARGP
ncbi:MAG TPA: YdgA family protein [Steroidobacteraceae bacterium]